MATNVHNELHRDPKHAKRIAVVLIVISALAFGVYAVYRNTQANGQADLASPAMTTP